MKKILTLFIHDRLIRFYPRPDNVIEHMKNLFIIAALVLGISTSISAEIASPPKRIVSLAPNMTEILYALGLGDNIVGVTSFCDYPEEAKKKPKIGGMSDPSLEAVVSLKPDIVVMTTDGNPKEFEERLRSLEVHTYVSQARRLADLPRGIRELGVALGVRERADALADKIAAGIRNSAGQKAALASPPSTPKKILFIVWPEPLIVAGPGTVINDAIALLRGENLAATAKTQYPKYSIEEAIRQAPDVIMIGKASGMDMQAISNGILQRLATVPAVKNGKVCFMGDSLYRLGPRVVKGIEELSECLK
ncbi:MAG TPA: cobalamin-binding protein [Nitrospirota bacterium]|nr:cobalamin-binding protein [Nitrospirota bacterium]